MKYVVPPVGILGGHVPLIPPAIAAAVCGCALLLIIILRPRDVCQHLFMFYNCLLLSFKPWNHPGTL